jgi:RimJ/RimL family protein N-acetyltransferase
VKAGTSENLTKERALIRPLLAPADPADAMAAYYALHYDERRVQLTLHRLPGGQVDGFAAVCQTGYDLFVPLVVLRAPAGVVDDLLYQALAPGRPYTVIAPIEARVGIEHAMVLDRHQVNRIYRLESASTRPKINVMVQPGEAPFRFEVRSPDGRVASAAGINWHTDRLAEIYVYTEAEYRNRGWATAVGGACVRALLEEGLVPIYVASQTNRASRHVALALGFRETGDLEFECRGQLSQG